MRRAFVIAEAGVNHNGRLDLAVQLVRVAARSGADAIKFQTFKADSLAVIGTQTVAYQAERAGADDQHAMLKRLELSEADHETLFREATTLGIEFMSTAFDPASAAFLVKLGIKRVKVPSGEVTNHPFLRELAATGLPVILSTGMADLEEVREAVTVIQEVQQRVPPPSPDERLVVLHCTSAYPTPYDDANLSVMATLAQELGVGVGFSDHSSGILLAPVAVALGARVIEKHFTLDRSLPGPDHQASLEPEDLIAMVKAIRSIEEALGDGVKMPRPSELDARKLVRRGLKAARDLPAGHILGENDMLLLRPSAGIAPKDQSRALGRKLKRSLGKGSPIEWADLA